MEDPEGHIPTDHPTITFPWRTDFFLWLIAEDPEMGPTGKLISAYQSGCGDCMNYWAKEAIEGDPLAVMHLLGSAYTWAKRQTEMTYLELSTGENPLFRGESVRQIKAMAEHRVSDMIKDANAMPKMVLYDCLDDALAAMTIAPKDGTGAPHKAPPPWEQDRELLETPDTAGAPAGGTGAGAAAGAPAGATPGNAVRSRRRLWQEGNALWGLGNALGNALRRRRVRSPENHV